MPDSASKGKIILVTLVMSVVCSALVTGVTVALRPVQEVNKTLNRQESILKVAGIWEAGVPLQQQVPRIETRMVDLELGWFTDQIDPRGYDEYQASKSPEWSIALSPQQDLAGIKRRANYAPVYLIRDAQGGIMTLVLPVHGYGLYSTLYGFLALRGDTNTVAGLSFYQHAETPGLGGEVDNLRWQALWRGKQAFDAQWEPALRVPKGRVDPADASFAYQVDGLSGATMTSRGVENLLRFWLGEQGFGPFLDNLRIIGEPT